MNKVVGSAGSPESLASGKILYVLRRYCPGGRGDLLESLAATGHVQWQAAVRHLRDRDNSRSGSLL